MSAFNKMAHTIRDRNWGGTSEAIACEPYVSGYSYISWSLPVPLAEILSHTLDRKGIGATNMQNDPTDLSSPPGSMREAPYSLCDVLESAMNSVTPPGGTINKVEIQGIGGLKWAVPGSMDYGNSISIKYLEMSGLPIHKIHRAWCNLIRDNHSGNTCLTGGTTKSNVVQSVNGKYNKFNYSGCLLYWTTKPDGVTVEFATAYSGLFPTKDPMDLFSGDITSIDKLEIEIEYNVDMIYNEDWVYEKAQDIAKKEYANQQQTRHLADGFRSTNGGITNGNWNRYTQIHQM